MSESTISPLGEVTATESKSAVPKAEVAKRPGFYRLLSIPEAKKFHLVAASFLALISSVMSLVPYVVLAYLLGLLDANDGAVRFETMIWLGVLIGCLAIVRYLILFTSIICSHLAAFDILYQLRTKLCAHLGTLSMGYFNHRRSGQIKKILSDDVEQLELFIAHHIPDIVTGAIQPIAVVVCLAFFDWRLALVALIPIPLAFTFQHLAFGGDKSRDYHIEYNNVLEDLNGSIVEYVRGMPVVKIFNLTTESFSAMRAAALAYKYFVEKITMAAAPAWAMFVVVTSSGLMFLLPFGLWFYFKGTISFQILMLFLMLGASYMFPIFKLAMMSGQLRFLIEGLYRVDEILAEKPMAETETPLTPKGNDVEFRNVSFTYGGRPALDQVDFRLPEGGVYALVGPSGAGKSTIGRLMARMWDITNGQILIGGVDIREMSTSDLMDRISFVFQETYLFSDSIRENIRMNLTDATDEEILKAAEAAQCLEFIEKSPMGLDTPIGEGGLMHLSGGEKQRLSMARVILKNSPIVVLDEATVFTDAENEAKIQEAFVRLMKGKTVLVIAHRLSTITDADQILVLDHGRLAAKGTHSELLEADGLYRSMWEAHTSAKEWKIGPAPVADMGAREEKKC
jgi:ATP-binding cassette subfamily B protein